MLNSLIQDIEAKIKDHDVFRSESQRKGISDELRQLNNQLHSDMRNLITEIQKEEQILMNL